MLGSIFTLIGVLLLIAAVGLFFVKKPATPGTRPTSVVSLKTNIILGAFGLFAILFNGLFFYAEPGMSYLVQYPTGTQVAVLDPGYSLKLYGNVIGWKKVLTIRNNSKVDKKETSSGMGPHIPVRFNDAVTADVGTAIRFRLPSDETKFIKMAVDFRSVENLITASLKPTVKEVCRNSARMLSAQEYIAGKGGEFEQAVQDQIESGIYMLETIELKDTTSKKLVTDEQRLVENRKTIQYITQKKIDNAGTEIRKTSPFKQYGITVAQSAIEYVDFEPKFKEMLGQQRDAAAEANVERQKAKKAEFEKQRIIAEGEKNKAKTRAEKEQEQVEVLISAETEKKQAQISLEKEQLVLEKNRKVAQSTKVLADADAYKKKAIMKADNALEIRINAMKAIHAKYAEMLGKHEKIVPDVIIGGNGKAGSGGSATDLVNLLTAQTAQQLGLNKSLNAK